MTDYLLEDIMQQIIDAADTLSHLPPVMLRARSGFWPEVVRRYEEAYGYTEATYRRRPSSQDITRMDEALRWLSLLDKDADSRRRKKIIWLRAEHLARVHRYGWRKIAWVTGLAPNTCRAEWLRGLVVIQTHIKKP